MSIRHAARLFARTASHALLSVCLAGAAAAAPTSPARQLNALFDEDWQWTMRNHPEWATTPGDHRFESRWTDNRAAVIVVDTGIHALGWTRQQAIDWMTERTGVARDDITAEVDRYCVWPGQALGYKIGQLKIIELRERARTALGDRFDLRRSTWPCSITGRCR